MKTMYLALVLSALAAPLEAQWLTYPTPGLPRTADGKPNLTAPVPRTSDGKVDMTGLWQRTNATRYRRDIAADLQTEEVKDWARELVAERMDNLGKDSMFALCLPLGPAYITGERMFKFVQTPGLILMLDQDLTYRQIFMDGRPLEKEPNPTWMGYSVGRWEGDTLVVDSFGYNDKTWLDTYGHPHSEAMRITERYTRRDFGHMDIEVALTDAAVYARPWTVKITAELEPDTELLEQVCLENGQKSLDNWVGRASDEKKNELMLPQATLEKYAGVYVEQDFWGEGPHPRTLTITIENGRLAGQLSSRGKAVLAAQTETTFSGLFGWGVRFVLDSQGMPTHLLEMHTSGNYRFQKK